MTDGEKFALKRRLKERYAWDKRRVYEIAEEEINSMKKTPTIAEILDKISAEIERLDTESWELSVTDVLNVIDRYRDG